MYVCMYVCIVLVKIQLYLMLYCDMVCIMLCGAVGDEGGIVGYPDLHGQIIIYAASWVRGSSRANLSHTVLFLYAGK